MDFQQQWVRELNKKVDFRSGLNKQNNETRSESTNLKLNYERVKVEQISQKILINKKSNKLKIKEKVKSLGGFYSFSFSFLSIPLFSMVIFEVLCFIELIRSVIVLEQKCHITINMHLIYFE